VTSRTRGRCAAGWCASSLRRLRRSPRHSVPSASPRPEVPPRGARRERTGSLRFTALSNGVHAERLGHGTQYRPHLLHARAIHHARELRHEQHRSDRCVALEARRRQHLGARTGWGAGGEHAA
jgi:hypothetical protein